MLGHGEKLLGATVDQVQQADDALGATLGAVGDAPPLVGEGMPFQ